MNVARIVALLRELADVLEEEELPDTRTPPEPGVRRKRVQRPRLPAVPANTNISPLDRAAARRHLKRAGFVEVK